LHLGQYITVCIVPPVLFFCNRFYIRSIFFHAASFLFLLEVLPEVDTHLDLFAHGAVELRAGNPDYHHGGFIVVIHYVRHVPPWGKNGEGENPSLFKKRLEYLRRLMDENPSP